MLNVRLLGFVLVCLVLFAAVSAERRARRKYGKGKTQTVEAGASEASEDVGGLRVEIIQRPDACERKTAAGDTIHVLYMGTLADGQPFDASGGNKDESRKITLGRNEVLPAFEEGMLGMCVDEVRKVIIPPQFAFGDQGYPPTIPPQATLTYLVKLTAFDS